MNDKKVLRDGLQSFRMGVGRPLNRVDSFPETLLQREFY